MHINVEMLTPLQEGGVGGGFAEVAAVVAFGGGVDVVEVVGGAVVEVVGGVAAVEVVAAVGGVDAGDVRPHDAMSRKWDKVKPYIIILYMLLKSYHLDNKGLHVVCRRTRIKFHKLRSCGYSQVRQMILICTVKKHKPGIHFRLTERSLDQLWWNLKVQGYNLYYST